MGFVTRLARLCRWAETPSVTPSRHLLATVTATTVDGLCAHVQVEFNRIVSAGETSAEVMDGVATHDVESALRRHVGALTGPDLPVAGEALEWVTEGVAGDAVIGDAFVVVCDIEVTHEFRRLVSSVEHPPPGRTC